MKPNEIAIQISCCDFSECDASICRGDFEELKCGKFIPGYSRVCGVIKQAGAGVEHLKIGQRVVGMLPLFGEGSMREWLKAEATYFVRVPDEVDMAQAAAVAEPGVRAFTALHYQMRALRGESVLVVDAAKGTGGEVLMQLAMEYELRVLAAVGSKEEATVLEARFHEKVEVVVVPDKAELDKAVLQKTRGLGVDHIYETLMTKDMDHRHRKARIGKTKTCCCSLFIYFFVLFFFFSSLSGCSWYLVCAKGASTRSW